MVARPPAIATGPLWHHPVLVALSGLALWLALFPAILAGPEGLLSAEVARVFMRPISELQPIRTARDAAIFIGAGALAVLAAGIIAVRARSPVWAFATVCGVLLIVLASHYRRFATYPEIIAVAILPIIASAFDSSFCNHRQSLRSAIRVVVLSIFLLSSPIGMLSFLSTEASTPSRATDCDPRTLQEAMRPYAGRVVLAEPQETPGLLYWTKVLTVGSFYTILYNVDAFLRLRAALRSLPSDTVPDAVRATHASLVLACPGRGRSLLVADVPPDTLLDRLWAGHPPPWLAPVDTKGALGYRLYKIINPP